MTDERSQDHMEPSHIQRGGQPAIKRDNPPHLSGNNPRNLVFMDDDGVANPSFDSPVARQNGPVSLTSFRATTHTSDLRDTDDAVLVLSTECDGVLHAEMGACRQQAKIRPGTLTFCPANLVQYYDFTGQTTNKVIALNDAFLSKVAKSDPRLPSMGALEPRISWIRPSLHRVIDDLHATMESGESGWRVLADANALMIAVELFRSFGDTRRERHSKSSLTQVEINKITDFIDDELERNFGLSDLAKILDRDQFSFVRAFRESTGSTPHQFVLTRRILQAKEQLARTNSSLVDIAYACGFSSQSHMTATFTKHLNISPGAYRKEAQK